MSRMRILALHGMGCSAKILRAQLSTFIRAVDDYYEIVCIDGFFESTRGPGIEKDNPGPFYTYTQGYAPSDILESHKRLRKVISNHGPFDGVLGFSQGGAIALAYLYHQQQDGFTPDFKFAIFLSTIVPFSADCRTLEKAAQHLCDPLRNPLPRESHQHRLASELRDILLHIFTVSSSIGATAAGYDNDYFFRPGADPAEVPRPLHPRLICLADDAKTPADLNTRLAIPTVHAHGRRDFVYMRESAEAVRELCEPRLARFLMHSGGHSPPQRSDEVAALAQAVHRAVRQYYEIAHL
ncbi:hypothetical protein MCOR30_003936 [Pyricularia oryzae]|nr:hypothetical protein MCOR01_009273 [Pyricularia oryzae]KAI6335071.1 hypothetical protein MCOR30_003936 [Pyricularia oryzae]KAI6415877.1 hypothetical protein MCOR20_001250 [Pyricularia oryzae]KAI6493947.1 hypothetical protein MCOR11_005994 [Pyricularia oryzae]